MVGQDRSISVRAEWDRDAKVWVATSEDLPGLVTESETFEGLVERIEAVVPELLSADVASCGIAESASIHVIVHADRELVVSA
jgi:predicted RNase H-like HicB family nuclease